MNGSSVGAEALNTLKNLDGIWSTSRADASIVRMRFQSDTDMGLAYSDARDRVERVRATLPEDLRERPCARLSS